MPRTTPLSRLLTEAIELDEADFGNVQAFDPTSRMLLIVAQQGFKQDFLDYFRCVRAFDSSACGRAAGLGGAVIIGDVDYDPGFAVHRRIAESAGFRSVKSQPIRRRDGALIGVVSTHCRAPRWDWDRSALAPLLPRLAALLEPAALTPASSR